MIDLHCHVLAGIDDGPATVAGSLELARVAAAAGIDTLVATPHVNSRSRNESAAIGRLAGELDARLRREGIGVRIVPGAEIAITHVAQIDPEELARLSLGGGGWLLMEPPFSPVASGLEDTLLELRRRGHGVVVAHPERSAALRREPRTLRALVDAGALLSVTAGSLSGRFGGEPRRFALGLAREGLIHNVTSDAHDAIDRPPGLTEAIAGAGLQHLAEWLTREVPEAILSGSPIPDPPPPRESPQRRRRWRVRR